MHRPTEPALTEQARRLLKVLCDDTTGPVLRFLLRQPTTQKQLSDDLGIDQARLSRAITTLKDLGLLAHGSGRGKPQQPALRDETYAVLQSANRLAEAINDERRQAQQQASRQLTKDQLQSTSTKTESDRRSAN